jgi:HSP20 family protein
MANVRNIIPKKVRKTEAGKEMGPFTHSMEEFFENRFPGRWMEGFFEPEVWRWPFRGETAEKFDVFPRIDIVDKEEALIVRAEMPGIKKEDLEITLAGDRLTLEARREFKEEEKKDEFYRHEMAYGRLFRAVRLPAEVVAKDAKAELKDGMLELTLPKVEATTSHKIKVA